MALGWAALAPREPEGGNRAIVEGKIGELAREPASRPREGFVSRLAGWGTVVRHLPSSLDGWDQQEN
jgi:hypothetical protein